MFSRGPTSWVSVSLNLFLSFVFLFFQASAEVQAAGSDWRANWERTVQAANTEGRVVVLQLLGQVYREAVRPFERAYPGIKLEATGRDITPRIRAEREAGQHLWDVYLTLIRQ